MFGFISYRRDYEAAGLSYFLGRSINWCHIYLENNLILTKPKIYTDFNICLVIYSIASLSKEHQGILNLCQCILVIGKALNVFYFQQ